jgi:hypothetical protein
MMVRASGSMTISLTQLTRSTKLATPSEWMGCLLILSESIFAVSAHFANSPSVELLRVVYVLC